MEVQKVMDVKDLKGIKSESVDVWKFDKQTSIIAKTEIIQVPSTFTALAKDGKHLPQWVLRVVSEPVATIGEGDEQFSFAGSELFNLIQDDEGNLVGFPEGEKSNLSKFMRDLHITHPSEMVGKTIILKAYDKVDPSNPQVKKTFLKFRY